MFCLCKETRNGAEETRVHMWTHLFKKNTKLGQMFEKQLGQINLASLKLRKK